MDRYQRRLGTSACIPTRVTAKNREKNKDQMDARCWQEDISFLMLQILHLQKWSEMWPSGARCEGGDRHWGQAVRPRRVPTSLLLLLQKWRHWSTWCPAPKLSPINHADFWWSCQPQQFPAVRCTFKGEYKENKIEDARGGMHPCAHVDTHCISP